MSEPTRSNFDRTSEWSTERQPVPNSDTAPGTSAGEHTAAFSAGEPVSPLAAPKSVPLPCDFGDYELLQEIAHGGMGVVYKARQKSLDRIVALKMILPHMVSTDVAVKRFYQEAQSAAKLEHPNIVPIYEIKEVQGRHYFTMAFIEGSTLKARVADHELSRKEILDMFVPIVDAVAFAHARGIIHRDLKPDNVLLDGQGRPRITDFGLAKQTSGGTELTCTGQILGTPAYMAPEQALGGDRRIGPEADVYALGSILYFLLAGAPPFSGKSVTEILFRVVNEAVPEAAPRVVSGLTDLDSICRKCLQKAPGARFADGGALLAALRALPADRIATPTELVDVLANKGGRFVDPEKLIAKPAAAPKKRRVAAYVALGLVGAVVVAGAIGWGILSRPASPAALPQNASIPSSLLTPVFAKSDIKIDVKMMGQVERLPDGVELLKDGQAIALDIVADQDAHFAIWTLEEDGNIHQIFPNDKETENKLTAGKHRILPGPQSRWQFTPTAAKGIEYIRVLASNRPLALAAAVERDGEFLKFTQRAGDFDKMLRGIRVTAAPEQKNGEAVVPFHVSTK